MQKFLLLVLFQTSAFIFFPPDTIAQESIYYSRFSDDSLYFEARNLAFAGEYDKSFDAALFLIERNPDYIDAFVLIGRLFSWEQNYDMARIYINSVLDKIPGYHDALSAIIDIEFWEGDYTKSIESARKALSFHPQDEEFLYKKARAEFISGRTDDSFETLEYLMSINSDNEEALQLFKVMSAPGLYYFRENNYLLTGYYGDYFDKPFSRRLHMGFAGYSLYTKRGPVSARLNFANTFIDGTGLTRYPSLQYEIESYPKLSTNSYLLLNYAFSRGLVFPDHRGAFEYFRNLPGGFEASLGLRFIHWDKAYFFYTGSVGKYFGNFLFSLRPYIFPGDNGISGSWYFSSRRYFKTADEYAGIVFGFGSSPDENPFDPLERINLNTTSAAIEFSKGISSDFMIRSSLRYEYEEFFLNSYRNRWSFNLGLRYYL